jgi:phosphatidylglycerophosphatase A
LAYLPVAPGTWGTLPGVVIFLVIALVAPQSSQIWLIAAALIVFCILTVALGPWAERHWKVKDPRVYVPDEVAGFLLTVLLFRTPDPFLTAGWAFVMARVTDILKLPPARQLERLPGGWGILVDDLVSSIYAAIILHLLIRFLPSQWFGGSPIPFLEW